MSEQTPKADSNGISVDQLAISADGELLGLSDEDLDAMAGGLVSGSEAMQTGCGSINDQC